MIIPDDAPPLTGFSFGGRARGWLADPIVQCVIFIVVASAVFILFPGLDLWFSGLFAGPKASGFPVGNLPAFQFLRNVNRTLTAVVPTVLVILVIVKLVRPDRPSIVPPAKTLFILATLAIASGIIVNLFFKDLWGRPRPVNVDVFGGQFPFVSAWRISNYCVSNCSFVSGEGSSSIWLLSLAVLVPPQWRKTAAKWLVAFAALVSLNRIAFGGHFLSDVVLAWGFTLLVMAIVYRFVLERPLPWFENARLEADLTRLGVDIRRRLGFPTPALDAAEAGGVVRAADRLPVEREENLPVEREENLPAEREEHLPAEREEHLPAEREENLPTEREEHLPAEREVDLRAEREPPPKR